MDITKELSKFNSNKDEIRTILERLQKEQEIAEQKTHIFHVLELANNLKQLAPTLIEVGCEIIRMINCDGRRSYSIELAPRRINEDRLDVRDEKQKYLPWFAALLDITPDFKLNNAFTNDFKDTNINLNKNIEEQMYNTLLSKELKSVLDYNLLNLDLVEGKEKKSIKANKM